MRLRESKRRARCDGGKVGRVEQGKDEIRFLRDILERGDFVLSTS